MAREPEVNDSEGVIKFWKHMHDNLLFDDDEKDFLPIPVCFVYCSYNEYFLFVAHLVING